MECPNCGVSTVVSEEGEARAFRELIKCLVECLGHKPLLLDNGPRLNALVYVEVGSRGEAKALAESVLRALEQVGGALRSRWAGYRVKEVDGDYVIMFNKEYLVIKVVQ